MSRKGSHEDVLENDDVFVYCKDTDLSSIPQDITCLRIDSSVRVIPRGAFRKRLSLANVEYQEGLEVIGEEAFRSCQRLQKIQQFPSTLVEIGISAFLLCNQLESFGSLPLSLKVIGDYAFYRCSKLQSVEIPNTACRLGTSAFYSCSSLTYARLPEGLKIIPQRLFAHCKLLVDVNVPSSVIEIEDEAFYFCTRLATIELPAGLEAIGMQAFSATALKHFHFPPTVETIGTEILAFCGMLESVILPPKLKTIPIEAFIACYKLKEVSIPKLVTCIGVSAFFDCGLTHIDLLQCQRLTSIGEGAFGDCQQLKTVLLPQTGGLKRIEAKTFIGCDSLTHLWIPPTVECIEDGAFANCASLLSVEVPETLEHIGFDLGGYAYKSLVNVYLPPTHASKSYQFREDVKLLLAAHGRKDLVRMLRGRFNSLPLHRACYFQSYHTLQDNLQSISNITQADPDAYSKVDFLGMSPFHILALSQYQCLDLFRGLLSSVSSSAAVDVIVRCRDVFGCTTFDYLCKNIHSTGAVDMTKTLLPSILEPSISFLGLDRWRDELQSGLERVQTADSISLGAEVATVFQKLEELERLEELSLLEMSVWRLKVEDENATSMDTRESCRMNCGSSIVLTNVMPFIYRAPT
ncbi:MAG: hypothetical protein SGBAC_006424 [Bacillariaceae sp.]